MGLPKLGIFRRFTAGLLFLPLVSWAQAPLADRAQMVGENSLYLSDAVVQSIKAKLEKMGVTMRAEPGAEKTFDNDMIYFLYDFFTFARPLRATQLVATTTNGPKLVWSEERGSLKVIYFTINAGGALFAHVVRKEAQLRGIALQGAKVEMDIAYSNELLKQLVAQLDQETIVRFVESYFKIGVKPRDKYVQFRQSEIGRLFSTFIDIPRHNRQQMALREIHRMPYGLQKSKGRANVLAEYLPNEQLIQVYEQAFSLEQAFGEDTYAHEICHAISKGLAAEVRDGFYALSWNQVLGQWALRPGQNAFVSDYSMTAAEEDFAESCGYYITKPEVLRNKAADKLTYMKDKIFRGVEFNNVFNSSLQTYLKAVLPADVTPPQLLRPIAETFDLQVREGKDAGHIHMKLTMRGVHDDLSGVRWLLAKFDEDFELYPELTPMADVYVAEAEVSLIEAPVLFEIKSVYLEDGSKNVNRISISKRFPVDPAILAKIKRAKAADIQPEVDLDMKLVRIEKQAPSDLGTVADITLPTVHTDKYSKVVVTFSHIGTTDAFSFQINANDTSLRSKPGENIRVRVLIPAQYPAGAYLITGLEIYLLHFSFNDWQFMFYNKADLPNLILNHETDKGKTTKPQIGANGIGVKAQTNSDGSAEADVTVPVDNLSMGNFSASVTVKGPDGKSYYGFTSGNTSGTNSIDMKVKIPPHFKSGSYSVESLDVREAPPVGSDNSLGAQIPRDVDNSIGRTQELLRERQIQRHIELQGDPSAF